MKRIVAQKDHYIAQTRVLGFWKTMKENGQILKFDSFRAAREKIKGIKHATTYTCSKNPV